MKSIEVKIMRSKPYKILVDWLPLLSIATTIILIVMSIYIYPQLHNTFPSHLNILGQVDGYGSKSMVFIYPFIPLVLGQLVRTIDKKYKSVLYTTFLILLTLFSIVIIGHMYLGFL